MGKRTWGYQTALSSVVLKGHFKNIRLLVTTSLNKGLKFSLLKNYLNYSTFFCSCVTTILIHSYVK